MPCEMLRGSSPGLAPDLAMTRPRPQRRRLRPGSDMNGVPPRFARKLASGPGTTGNALVMNDRLSRLRADARR